MALLDLVRDSPGVRSGLSIAAAVGLYGISFGALSVTTGLSVLQTCVLSLVMFTGGSQFAFIGVLGGGGAPAAALGAASLLGLRNGVYAMQLNALLKPPAVHRPLLAHVTIDESVATGLAQSSLQERRRGTWTAGVGIFVLWNVFTLVGALVGDQLGDPRQWGLDGAAVAAFLALLWPRLRAAEPIATAVACALVTVLTIPVLPPGTPILAAAVVAALIAWVWHRVRAGRDPLLARETR